MRSPVRWRARRPRRVTRPPFSATVSGVTAEAAKFLEAHPDANDALTQAGSLPPDEAKASVRSYFFGHVDEYFALQTIAQPVADLKAQCNSNVSVSSIGALLDALNE